MTNVPCPFRARDGKACPGHIVRITGDYVGAVWELQDDGGWSLAGLRRPSARQSGTVTRYFWDLCRPPAGCGPN